MIHIFIFMHLIGDYVVQNDKDVELREKKVILGNSIHLIKTFFSYLVILVITLLLFQIFTWVSFWEYLLYIAILSMTHFLIDLGKSYLSIKLKEKKLSQNLDSSKFELKFFLVDQIFHVISIFLIIYFFDITIDITSFNLFVILNSILIAVFFGHELIKRILYCTCTDYVSDSKNFNPAKVIGMLERLLMTPAMILGAYEFVAIIIGLKVFTDFRNKESQIIDRNAFIIGNLLSISCSALGLLYYYLFAII